MEKLETLTDELIQSSQALEEWSQAIEISTQKMEAQTFLFDLRDYLAMFTIFEGQQTTQVSKLDGKEVLTVLNTQQSQLVEWLQEAKTMEDSGDLRRQCASVEGILEFNHLLQNEYPKVLESTQETIKKDTTKGFWQRLFHH